MIIDDRTLQEIYFPAFQAAVQQAKAGSVMCSYSTINGDFACQSPFLMNQTLDQAWGYPGFVTSDYGALHDTSGGALAGLDQEQPFNTFFGTPLEDDVNNGTIPRAVLNTMVQRIFTEMFRFNLFNNPPTGTPTTTVTTAAHQAVGTDVADTAATLLKNASHTLPLSAKPRRHGGGDRPGRVGAADLRRRRERVRDPVADRDPARGAPGRGRRRARTSTTSRGCPRTAS